MATKDGSVVLNGGGHSVRALEDEGSSDERWLLGGAGMVAESVRHMKIVARDQ